MSKDGKFSFKKRLNSFKYAFNGLKILIREEHNSRIHLFAAVCTVAAGLLLPISLIEWVVVIFCIGWVFACELINSALENLADFVSPQKHELIKKVKDLAAASVLIAAIAALVAGLIIFVPKIIRLF